MTISRIDPRGAKKIQGKDAYEVRGKDKRGKVREVEVSADGEVLAIE
jgi:hypothetical protein